MPRSLPPAHAAPAAASLLGRGVGVVRPAYGYLRGFARWPAASLNSPTRGLRNARSAIASPIGIEAVAVARSLIFRAAALDASGQCLAIFVGTSGIGSWMEP